MKFIRLFKTLAVALAGTAALVSLACVSARCQDSGTNNPAAAADKAWREVYRATQSPFPPTEWQEKPPTAEEQAKFYVPYLLKGAEKARDFYTQYPDHPRAADARKKEFDLLSLAGETFGDTNAAARAEVLQAERLEDPKVSDDERVEIHMQAIHRLMNGMPNTQEQLVKAAWALQRDFPKREEAYQVLLMAMQSADTDSARTIAKQIMDSPAPDAVKSQAEGMLKRFDAVGKPVDIQFTDVDGRGVDLAAMKDKVVLIDFWATWCPPCRGEVPNVRAAYQKLHDKGFEVVGISFDQDKAALKKYTADEHMDWPQYFDGKGFGNKFGQEFGINGIPTMWLVDKKGNLRDVNARGTLEEKVTKLLAE
jgi:thiol-disulfide isomerase/thioredoxin